MKKIIKADRRNHGGPVRGFLLITGIAFMAATMGLTQSDNMGGGSDNDDLDSGICCSATSQSLLYTLSTGGNYHVLIEETKKDEIRAGQGRILIENKGILPATVFLVSTNPNGNTSHVLALEVGESRSFPMAMMNSGRDLLVIGIQNLEVTTVPSINIDGRVTNHFPVVTPQRQLSFVKVTTPSRGEITVGIDALSQAHYTVYGNVIGDWNGHAVVLEDGTELPTTLP